ncbi:hypothetical protein NPIL_682781 [Nephila pilipes]|uniref:Uncharacterized protein n=1 Tax=Nephila pilipes TaxID=299642 RepID=A0A8X6NJ31_NEPPI|nr:hypothetical protein NPIL_340011 [Nephila pilipes]GFU07746.1 hypothetical protein NPIL_682781 [Nephila pilipes]
MELGKVLCDVLEELYFCLSNNKCSVRFQWQSCKRSYPAATVERHTTLPRSTMVCGTLIYECRSSLVRIAYKMTSKPYVDDTFQPVMQPVLEGRPNTIYKQLNARPHTVHISQHAL